MLLAWLGETGWGTPERQTAQPPAAAVTSWAIYGAALQWSRHDQTQSVESFALQVLPLIMASLDPSFKVPIHRSSSF